MFTHKSFTHTVKHLSTFNDIMEFHRHRDGIPHYAELELEAFKIAQEAFLQTYESVVLTRTKKAYPDKPLDRTIEENRKIIKQLYCEIKDVHHDDNGMPYIDYVDPDSDSESPVMYSDSESDSDSDGPVEEIPMPTKKRIIIRRKKPKN